jgi:hypothetical protein
VFPLKANYSQSSDLVLICRMQILSLIPSLFYVNDSAIKINKSAAAAVPTHILPEGAANMSNFARFVRLGGARGVKV